MKYALALLFLAGCSTMPKPQTCQFKSVGAPDGVDRDDVACVMNASVVTRARQCYEELLSADELEFRLIQAFEISKDGRAEKIVYDPDIGTSSFGVCMTRALKEATFPAHTSPKPVTITYPWQFKRLRR